MPPKAIRRPGSGLWTATLHRLAYPIGRPLGDTGVVVMELARPVEIDEIVVGWSPADPPQVFDIDVLTGGGWLWVARCAGTVNRR